MHFFVMHERMTSGLRHTPTDTHIHTEHACSWLSWSLVCVHPWHAFYMHICHKCIWKHLVVPRHLLFLPSRPMCLLLTLLKHTHAAFAAVVRNKSAGSWAHVKDLRERVKKKDFFTLFLLYESCRYTTYAIEHVENISTRGGYRDIVDYLLYCIALHYDYHSLAVFKSVIEVHCYLSTECNLLLFFLLNQMPLNAQQVIFRIHLSSLYSEIRAYEVSKAATTKGSEKMREWHMGPIVKMFEYVWIHEYVWDFEKKGER